MIHYNQGRRNQYPNFPSQGRYPSYYPTQGRRMRAGVRQQQTGMYVPNQTSGSRTAFIKKAFTSDDGQFDMSRTAQTVDQVIKTVQQVSPYVRKVGSYFLK
ncbi:YppG family protein [Alkalihalobacillus sp. NPDC078783]